MVCFPFNIVWNIPMSRCIRVVLHAVIAESLKMPNSCFAIYSSMPVCRARVHILRSLKSLSFDIYVCLSRSMHFYCILRLCWDSPQSFYKYIHRLKILVVKLRIYKWRDWSQCTSCPGTNKLSSGIGAIKHRRAQFSS